MRNYYIRKTTSIENMVQPVTVHALSASTRVTQALSILILLVVIAPPIVNAQAISEKASIMDAQYAVQGDTITLTVKVAYSYSHEQVLKLSVATVSPASSLEKTFTVGPGTDLKSLDFQLTPPSASATIEVSISLYVSNQKGDNLELLHIRNVSVNFTKGQQPDSGGGLILLGGLIMICLALYFGRGRKPKPEPKKRKR